MQAIALSVSIVGMPKDHVEKVRDYVRSQSARDLAKRAKVSFKTIYNFLDPNRSFNYSTLVKIERVMKSPRDSVA